MANKRQQIQRQATPLERVIEQIAHLSNEDKIVVAKLCASQQLGVRLFTETEVRNLLRQYEAGRASRTQLGEMQRKLALERVR